MKGRLIVIEGLDGSGKQTQTKLLEERLRADGVPVKSVSFPNYAQPSSALVKQYLAGDFGQADEVSAYAASSFYSVDRYASFQQRWKNEYLAGYTILADRYTTSNIVHQMSKLPRDAWKPFAEWLEDFEYHKLGLPRPDAVVYLDMHPDVSRSLLFKRYEGDESRQDIHEKNLTYLQQCRSCALFAAERFGWKTVACSDHIHAFGIEQIAQMVYDAVKSL